MNFFGKAEETVQRIIRAFQEPKNLAHPLALMFIQRKDQAHFRKWSWLNQLLVMLHGFSDARGYRQWQEVGRNVKKDEKAFHILAPVTKKTTDKTTGEEKVIVVGFKSIPVFGLEQTDGQPLPASDPDVAQWIDSLPLIEVAKAWGLAVDSVDGTQTPYLGLYRKGKAIVVGVKNLATWAHELVHAADDRNGNLKEKGQHWRSETVAELGGAVLLEILGFSDDADLGGCWRYVNSYAETAQISVTDACVKVLDRTCKAVALILDTAENLKESSLEPAEPILTQGALFQKTE